jgi:outer membrane protein OmpA-like peptidoglycan-associated protein
MAPRTPFASFRVTDANSAVTTSSATIASLLQPPGSDNGAHRKVLAGLLVELARSVDENVDARASGVAPFDHRLEQLRRLLVGHEIETLSRLTRQIDDPEQLAALVSRILPAALAQAWAENKTLGQILAPAFEEATRSSIRSDPRTLVNILHPLMGPAIGRSISETIDGIFQSLNETLKYSLSWRGLMWRWEAWRTGTSFTEIVLKHTLVYQVEHVFLIHRHTGLLIAHVAAPDAESQDPQLVSSMLVAIQDFIRDSFSGADQQGLDTIRLGELRVWSEPGPYAALVAVIRGNPPESLHEIFGRTISRINADHHDALKDFNGDSSGFSDVDAALTECVQLRQRAPLSTPHRARWLVASVALALLGLLGVWQYDRWHDQHEWESYVERLRNEAGIVVTDVGTQNGRWSVSGLRDPLAVDPQIVLQQSSIDPDRVVAHWQAYQSLDATFVLKRLMESLKPPPTISLAIESDRIVALGSASAAWLQRARATANALPTGAAGVDFTQVQDLDNGALGKLRTAIQSHEILFDNNGPVPSQAQNAILDQVAQEVRDLAALSSKLAVTPRVMLTGHSDATGSEMFNLSLSQARAEAIRVLLKKRGVDPNLLAVRAAGPFEPVETGDSDAARSHNRRVSFTVEIDQ